MCHVGFKIERRKTTVQDLVQVNIQQQLKQICYSGLFSTEVVQQCIYRKLEYIFCTSNLASSKKKKKNYEYFRQCWAESGSIDFLFRMQLKIQRASTCRGVLASTTSSSICECTEKLRSEPFELKLLVLLLFLFC